ncbi:MAG: DUF4159 domain-containing protein [Candidatus Latescibacteria bacterium]|nr:DUF4159 domain-containing protein [Candidatus Latescibacterota bacterium]
MRRAYKLTALASIVLALLGSVAVGFANLGPGRYNDFTFGRVVYSGSTDFWNWRGGTRWAVDFPSSDENIIRMLRQQTNLRINEPQAVEITDPALFEIPFLYILEVGYLEWSQTEADILKEYLLRGGFLMVDDFHGSREWEVWQSQIRKVFPDLTIEDVPMDHPVFHCYYDFNEYPQIPSTGSLRRGRTFERDGVYPRCRGIFDDQGRLMVLINWNTDIGDGWEWAGTTSYYYPREYAESAYKLGVNYAIYAMTH